MSTESDGSNERPLITHAPTLDVVIERTPFVAPTPVEPLPVPDKFSGDWWKLTTWDKITLFVDDAWTTTKLGVTLLPHLFTIWYGYNMNIPQRLAAGISSVIAALLAHFALDLPTPILTVIDLGVTFLVGLLIPTSNAKPKE